MKEQDNGVAETERLHSVECRAQEARRTLEAEVLQAEFNLKEQVERQQQEIEKLTTELRNEKAIGHAAQWANEAEINRQAYLRAEASLTALEGRVRQLGQRYLSLAAHVRDICFESVEDSETHRFNMREAKRYEKQADDLAGLFRPQPKEETDHAREANDGQFH